MGGVCGTVPWNAMGFLTMYMQYCGHSDATSALVATAVLLGKAIGGLLGGFAGDALAQWSPAHGRPCVAQISVLAGIPFVFGLVWLAPTATGEPLIVLSLILGLVASW